MCHVPNSWALKRHIFMDFISEMGGATMVVIYRTEQVFKNIVLFWVLCALDVNCIQPIQRKWCDLDKLRAGLYAGRKASLSYFHTMSLSQRDD